MKSISKKFISLALAAVMVISMLPTFAITALADTPIEDICSAATIAEPKTFNNLALYHHKDGDYSAIDTDFYSNIVYSSVTDKTGDTVFSSDYVESDHFRFKFAVPGTVVGVYDGVTSPSMPVILEQKMNNAKTEEYIQYAQPYATSTDEWNARTVEFTDDWKGYGTDYTKWPTTYTTDSFSKEAATQKSHSDFNTSRSNDSSNTGNVGKSGKTNHLSNTDSYFWVNTLQYYATNAPFDDDTYSDVVTNPTIETCTTSAENRWLIGWTDRYYDYRRFDIPTTFYVINYKPIYDILNTSSPATINVDGAKNIRALRNYLLTGVGAAKYTEASRRIALERIAAVGNVDPNTANYSTVATGVSTVATAIKTAYDNYVDIPNILEVASYDITFDKYGTDEDKVVSLEYGTSAEAVAAQAPANHAADWDEDGHYTYAWPSFAAATAAVTYTEQKTTTPHNYSCTSNNDGTHTLSCSVNSQNHNYTEDCDYNVFVTPDEGDENGYTTSTCKVCNYVDIVYNDQNWEAFDSALKTYEDVEAEEDYETKYTAASRETFEAAVGYKLTKSVTVSQAAIDNATTALENAVSGLAIQNYTVTFDMVGNDRDTSASLAYGSSAEAVAAEAPALKEANHNDTYHYTYAWNTSFAAVTGNATYTEEETETAHSYVDVHTEADGDANGYTTYTCQYCSHQYVEYDTQNWTAYDTAVAAYDAKAAEEDFTAKYTEASRTAFASAASSKLTKADTVSQSAINTATTALENAVSGLTVQTYKIRFKPDGVYASSTEVYLPYGTTAEEVATYAPANTTPKFANQYQHRVYTWPEFATVTADAYYNEQNTKVSHTITDEYHAADGETNGYTTHTCYICGGTQHETYDERDYSAYTAAVEDYEATKASEDYAEYTVASKTAYEGAVDTIIGSVSIYDNTKSTLYYQNRAAEIIAAKSNLVVDKADFDTIKANYATGVAKLAAIEAGELYTESTVQRLIDALNTANALIANENSTPLSAQDDVDAAAQEILDAIAALAEPEIADGVDETTVDSFNAAKDAIINIDTDIYDLQGQSVDDLIEAAMATVSDDATGYSTMPETLSQADLEAIISACLATLSANVKLYTITLDGGIAAVNSDAKFAGTLNQTATDEWEAAANTKVVFTAADEDSAWYMSYEIDGVERRDRQYQGKGETLTLPVVGDISIEAVAESAATPNKVTIYRAYDNNPDSKYVVQSIAFADDSYVLPAAPALAFYNFVDYTVGDAHYGVGDAIENITDDITVKANYTYNGSNAYTVVINGTSGELYNDSAAYNDKITVSDPDAYAWINTTTGKLFYVGSELTFFVAESVELTAITSGTFTTPQVTLRSEAIATDSKITINGQVNPADNVVEYGVLVGVATTGTLNDADLTLAKAASNNPATDGYVIVRAKSTKMFGANQFTIGINTNGEGTYKYIGYAVYKDADGNLHTVYSDGVQSYTFS